MDLQNFFGDRPADDEPPIVPSDYADLVVEDIGYSTYELIEQVMSEEGIDINTKFRFISPYNLLFLEPEVCCVPGTLFIVGRFYCLWFTQDEDHFTYGHYKRLLS